MTTKVEDVKKDLFFFKKNSLAKLNLFVWLWLVVNDRKFSAGTIFFSHTQTSQQYFFTNQQRYEPANRTGRSCTFTAFTIWAELSWSWILSQGGVHFNLYWKNYVCKACNPHHLLSVQNSWVQTTWDTYYRLHSSCTQPTSLAPSESVYLRTRQTMTTRVL